MSWLDDGLRAWLEPQRSLHDGYRHTVLSEDSAHRDGGLSALAHAVDRAHHDAKTYLADVFATTLDPFGEDQLAKDYPSQLNTLTLQGYLGEIFAGLYAENYAPHGVRWEVPAFLFRFSNAAIEGLDRRLQLGGEATRVPGRTGDDCVAFLRDGPGRIVAWLNCEAKCTITYPGALIADGHRQLSRPLVSPVSLYQMIDILRASDDPANQRWVAALRLLRTEAAGIDGPTRADLFICVCGRKPRQHSTWITPDRPHREYDPKQPLEAVELHLDNLDAVLTAVYPGHMIDRA